MGTNSRRDASPTEPEPGHRPCASGPDASLGAGGSLTVLSAGTVTTVDPGVAYLEFDTMATSLIHRSIYYYGPLDADLPSPDLAVGPPSVLHGGEVLTIQLREGIRFAPPINRSITADDVRYGLERSLHPRLGNQYAREYLASVEGVGQFLEGRTPHLSGVRVRDNLTLDIRLTQPAATLVTKALSLPFSSPVPIEFDGDDPEDGTPGGRYSVGTGPYMVDRAQSAGGLLVLTRNPRWDPRTDIRPAPYDSIVFEAGHADPEETSWRILFGRNMVNGDFMPPPSVLNSIFGTPLQSRVRTSRASLQTRFVAFNQSDPLMADLNARRAICAGFDRHAMAATRGGNLLAPIATHLLPPGVPGFTQAGGWDGPALEHLRHQSGSIPLARHYLSLSAYDSIQVRPLLMLGSSTGDARQASKVALEQLQQIGLPVRLELVPTAEMYRRCSLPTADVAICPTLGWGADFPDGQAIIGPLFGGASDSNLSPTNWCRVHGSAVVRAIRKAGRELIPQARAQAWAEVDVALMERAALLPLDWGQVPNICSPGVDGVVNHLRGTWDLAYCSQTSGGADDIALSHLH